MATAVVAATAVAAVASLPAAAVVCSSLPQTFDEFRASELDAHEETLHYLAGLDRQRSVQLQGREATEGTKETGQTSRTDEMR